MRAGRAGPIALAAVVLLSGTPAVGSPDPSCAGSVEQCVRGSGSFQVTAEGEDIRVTYQCDAVASAPATSTTVRSVDEDGCLLRRGTAIVDRAVGISFPGSFATTADTAILPAGPGILRVCWNVLALFVTGGRVEDAGCSPEVSSGPAPQIEDIAGDANGLNAAGVQLDTRPASYDPADLLAVRMETTYDAIPVGDDGIRYEPTGLAITTSTLETPGTIEGVDGLVYRLDTMIAGCRSYLEAWIYNDGAFARWDQVDGPPSSCPDGNQQTAGDGAKPEWSVTVDPVAKTVRSWYPFGSLSAEQAEYLNVGNALRTPRGGTFALRELSFWNGVMGRVDAGTLLDATAIGPDFVIGSDVPADVPCTKGCPG